MARPQPKKRKREVGSRTEEKLFPAESKTPETRREQRELLP